LNNKANKIDKRITNAKVTYVICDNEKSQLIAMAETIHIISNNKKILKGGR